MNNMKSENMLTMARALLTNGGWYGSVDVAELTGLPKHIVHRSLPCLPEHARHWRGNEVLEVRMADSQRQRGRKVREYRVIIIKDDARPRDLLLKHFSRNPDLTLHELSTLAGCSIGTAHSVKKELVDAGAGQKRERPSRPRKRPESSGHGCEVMQYQQTRRFREIWPMRWS